MQFLITDIKRFESLNDITYTRKFIPVILLIIFTTILYIYVRKTNTAALEEERNKIPSGVYEVLSELEKFSQQNEELKKIIENYLNNLEEILQKAMQKKLTEKLKQELETATRSFRDENHYSHNTHVAPSTEYEQLRRRVKQTIQQMCNYFSFELEKIRVNLKFEKKKIDKEIENALELSGEYKKLLISDIDQMRLVDGYESWREKEAEDLSDLVQRRLQYIQNPLDCKNAKKILCDMETNCGLGCQLHHIVHCLIAAYATERTMVLNSRDWVYHEGGWEEIFQPVSQTCTEYNMAEHEVWPGSANTKLLFYPRIYAIKPRPPYLPLSVPEDLVPRIQKLHGDPSLWWISQFVKYLFKLKREKMEKVIKKNLGWKTPVVGVQIRRTDKLNYEASYHRVEEYMSYVEDYYQTLEMNNTKVERRVFLATDDPLIIAEIRTKYPDYTLISDKEAAKKAGVSTRYTDLNGILSDIIMLSLSDYLVCTFSSNVCRTAYEIMQNYYPDASERFKSLDYNYFFAGQRPHDHEVLLSHEPRNENEISIKPGDLLYVINNLWNGFSKGKNRRTLKVGLFPTFKVKDNIRTIKLVKLPTYLNVGLFV